ncbi:hypothetical protein [Thermocrispum municipale]|mgnify:CR=1 FL=1|jgi:hypothetical protein|uniref:hypothetical protein n=1 Tax=Thermocrispum municipale TaxID=37926 RepID=UPI00040FA66A|nr:hypothetical protein [Thermocrispum municipale]
MEMLSEQFALVREREHAHYSEPAEGDVAVADAVAKLTRQRRARRWERLAHWASERAERVRSE